MIRLGKSVVSRLARMAATVLVTAMVASVATAGTIRHDRSDHAHLASTRGTEMAAVAQLLIQGSPSCSGTLIAPQWILTATHCIWPGGSSVYSRQTVVVGDQQFDVGPKDIFIHPDWLSGGFDVLSTSGDIALIRLPRPAVGVTPIKINRTQNEIGQTAYMAGFGTTGTGLTGNRIRTAVKRAGMNVVDATLAEVSFPSRYPFQRTIAVGSRRALLTDFDSPDRDASTMGGPAPLNLEYTTAQGDSGGPLLLYQNRVFTVAGITSGGIDGFAGSSDVYSYYSDVATFTRVASYLSWVDQVMRGKGIDLENYIQLLQKSQVAAAERAMRERDAELRSLGIRLQSRSGVANLPTSVILVGDQSALLDPAAALLRAMRSGLESRVMEPRGEGLEGDEIQAGEVSFPDCQCCGHDEVADD